MKVVAPTGEARRVDRVFRLERVESAAEKQLVGIRPSAAERTRRFESDPRLQKTRIPSPIDLREPQPLKFVIQPINAIRLPKITNRRITLEVPQD